MAGRRGCQAAGWRLAWRPRGRGAGSGSSKAALERGPLPSPPPPSEGSPPGAFWLRPSHLLAQRLQEASTTQSPSRCLRMASPVSVPASLLLSATRGLSLARLLVFPVICLFLSSCPSWACGHQVPVGVRSGPGVFLSLHVVAPPPGGSVSPAIKSPDPQQLRLQRGISDLLPTGHRLNQWERGHYPVGPWSPCVG